MKTKRRVLATTKILAVAALTATAGCAPTMAAPAATAHPEVVTVIVPAQGASQPEPSPQPVEAVAVVAASADVTPPEAAPAAPPRPQEDPALQALRRDLERAGRNAALTQIERFRPLCDGQGYPLVGNLVRKMPVYGPAAFCAELRAPRSQP
jgi:hypothetical protein